MSILAEFKKFAVKGNAIDLAVGVIIGAAFGKIVTSLVSDVIMPPIGMLLGKMDFSTLEIVLNEKASIRYGAFINNVIDFLIVAMVIFLVIRQINRFEIPFMKEPPKVPTTKDCPFCCSNVPIKATRCPHCTSELGELKV